LVALYLKQGSNGSSSLEWRNCASNVVK